VRVALLPTGRTEWHGLPRALQRLFPGHDFYALPTEEEIRSHPESFPSPGFTSSTLSLVHESSPPESASDLVARAAQAALGDSRRRAAAADLVVVFDDVELVNAHQPDRVARVFRAASNRHLNALHEPIATRTRNAFRDRVSFHLLAPMIEALFFADPAALAQAGVAGGRTVGFAAACDPEQFQTTDAAYLAETEASCRCLVSMGLPPNRRRKLQPKWFDTATRARHPKGYLQWLCLDGAAKNCTMYHETQGGSRALAGLNWLTLVSRPANHVQYVRALLADLADGLMQTPTTGPVSGLQAPLTSRFTSRNPHTLRNL
jgi:hypothetical protein